MADRIEKLVTAITEQVSSARTIASSMQAIGFALLIIIGSASYLDVIGGKAQAVPGADVAIPLALLLPFGPVIVLIFHVLTLHQYKGLGEACRALTQAEPAPEIRRALTPNDPVVQWLAGPPGQGWLPCLIAISVLVVVPASMIMLMALASLAYQDRAIIIGHAVIAATDLAAGLAWCWHVAPRSKAMLSPSWAIVALGILVPLGFVLAIYGAAVYSYTSDSTRKFRPVTAPLAALERLDAAAPVMPAIQGNDDWTRGYDAPYAQHEEFWFCRWTGIGCVAPNLAHIKVSQAKRDGGTLTGRLKLNDRRLQFAELSNADLLGADLSCADLRRARMFGANFTYAILQRTRLEQAGMSGADFSHAYLRQLDLRGADLRGISLNSSSVQDVLLTQADLRWVDMSRAQFSAASKDDELYKAALPCSGANAQSTIMGMDLRKADLREAKMVGTVLNQAHLESANLSGADLRGAKLRGAFLNNAVLQGANLTGADLREATLDGAMLDGANLAGTDLRGATISGVRYDYADFTKAVLWPPSRKPAAWGQKPASYQPETPPFDCDPTPSPTITQYKCVTPASGAWITQSAKHMQLRDDLAKTIKCVAPGTNGAAALAYKSDDPKVPQDLKGQENLDFLDHLHEKFARDLVHCLLEVKDGIPVHGLIRDTTLVPATQAQ